MEKVLDFSERLELFSETVTNPKDYVFSSSILIPKKVGGNNFYIKERKNNVTSVVLNVEDLKEHKKALRTFYFLVCEILLSYIRNEENNKDEIVISSPNTPIDFYVVKEDKECWIDLYKKLHNESMSYLYILKL